MSANRKELRVSFEPTPRVSVRGHRHQASDSGLGSDYDYDYDSYGTSPDYSPSAQDYYNLQKTLNDLTKKHDQLEQEYQNLDGHARALQNTIAVLEGEKKTLSREKRHLKEENEVLRSELHTARTGKTRDATKMSGALPPQSAPSKDSKSRRSESKARKSSEEKERERRHREAKEAKDTEKRHKEDKERLLNRFTLPRDKDDSSAKSNASSGRSQRSYIEPYGPATPRHAPSVVETDHRPRTKRSDSSYSTMRPQVVVATTTTAEPVFSDLPRSSMYPDYDNAAVYDDPAAYVEDGNYYPHALPSESSRGRRR